MGTQPIERPTAAYVLSLIGGILGLIIGGILLLIGVASGVVAGYYFGAGIAALMIFAGLGIWGIITGAIVTFSAVQLNNHPMDSKKWGTIILVFSIIGLTTLLGLIGGILALVWKPSAAVVPMAPTAPAAQTTGGKAVNRICPKCGRVIDEDVKFCPHCGNKLE
jgi:hypothetical protein